MRWIQPANPGAQTLLHTHGAFADLGRQRWVEKVLAIFQVVFIDSGIQLGDLFRAEALQQLDGGRGDLHGDAFQRRIDFGELRGQLRGVGVRLVEQLAGALQPVDIRWQFAAAMPFQVCLQARREAGFLLAVLAQVSTQSPGNQPIEIAVGQASAATGRQQHAQGKQ
ncbi:hypothetical protein D9M68_815400 [compost metagenome]